MIPKRKDKLRAFSKKAFKYIGEALAAIILGRVFRKGFKK